MFVVHTGKVWAGLDDVATTAVQIAVEGVLPHQMSYHILYQVQPGSSPIVNVLPEVEFTALNKKSSENNSKT